MNNIGEDLSFSEVESLLYDGQIILFKCRPASTFLPVFLSRSIKQITGFDPDIFYNQGDKWINQVHPDDRTRFRKAFREVFESGRSGLTYRFYGKNRKLIRFRHKWRLEEDEEGNTRQVLGIAQDMTGIRIDGEEREIYSSEREKELYHRNPGHNNDDEYDDSISINVQEWIIKRSLELDEKLEHQRKIEQQLRKKLLYEYALTKISTLLISNPEKESFDESLNILMEVVDCDRVHLSRNYIGAGGGLFVRRIHEVCRDEADALIEDDTYEDIFYEDIPWFYENFANGKIVYGFTGEMPSPEWEWLENQDVQSLVALPVYIDDDWYGYVSFEDIYRKRRWEEDQLAVLRSAATILGAAKKREQQEESVMPGQPVSEPHLAEMLPGAFVVVDQTGSMRRVGQHLASELGYSVDELVGEELSGLAVESEGELVDKFISGVLETGRQQTELNLSKKDGGQISFYVTGKKIRLGEETAIIIDGVELSGADMYNLGFDDASDKYESVIGEIHHRVKNNLSILTSLFDLQKSEVENTEVKNLLSKTQARINTFALLHESLYQSGRSDKIPVKYYITQLIQKISTMFEQEDKQIDLKITIDEFSLPFDKALPLALLINEIAANSYEHAFRDLTDGYIKVEIQSKNEKVWVHLEDNGSGMESFEQLSESDTLGNKLIQIYLKQLEAKWSVNVRNGVNYEIIFDIP